MCERVISIIWVTLKQMIFQKVINWWCSLFNVFMAIYIVDIKDHKRWWIRLIDLIICSTHYVTIVLNIFLFTGNKKIRDKRQMQSTVLIPNLYAMHRNSFSFVGLMYLSHSRLMHPWSLFRRIKNASILLPLSPNRRHNSLQYKDQEAN